jgi:hypothetical protein
MPNEVPAAESSPPRLRLMVSSTVYGLQDQLDQVFAMLEGYGYEVWMSHKGTLPTNPRMSNFANCLKAVDQCDVFLGIITGRYGSGVEPRSLSITHQEMNRAVELKKLWWFLVHHDVVVARQLLKQFRFDDTGKRKRLKFKKTAVLDDIRVLEMYESAIQHDKPLPDRAGNWVHEYLVPSDALKFIEAQFREPARVRQILDG